MWEERKSLDIKNGDVTETEIESQIGHILSEFYMNIDWQDVISEYIKDFSEDDCETVFKILENVLQNENW